LKLKVNPLNFEANKLIVMLNAEDAKEIDVMPLERLAIRYKNRECVAIVDISNSLVKEGEIGLSIEVSGELKTRPESVVTVRMTTPPKSVEFIKKRMSGKELSKSEIEHIINDTVENRLSEIELTAFVMSLHHRKMSIKEAAYLSKAMIGTSKTLKLGRRVIYDKHSIGGVPGDKTSILVVPIVASMGLTIPKTSSRAITSPAGTADRFECIAPVELGIDEIERVVRKTGGCLVWGGAVDLAPADDMFIKIEYPFSIDPFLLPSVMSKKKAAGAKYLVIDIPTGKETKVKTLREYRELSEGFIELGKKLGIKVRTLSTFGDQPLGRAVGPALEAREALSTIMWKRPPIDLVEKATAVAGVLLEFAGYKNGKKVALDALKSGNAYRKLREIIKEQGGNPDIKPGDIKVGRFKVSVKSKSSGIVEWMSTKAVGIVAREAGAPKDKGAGIYFHKKLNDKVRKGDTLFEIYAEKKYKLRRALNALNRTPVMNVDTKFDMVLKVYPEEDRERFYFILER